MFGPLTRAQMRDQVRRELGMVPPIDDGAGAAGVLPPRHPVPSNAALNLAIDAAVAFFDRKCRMAGDWLTRQFPVPAQTASGPFVIPLQTLAPFGSTMDLKHVSWQGSAGSAYPLDAANRDDLDRNRMVWETAVAGTPSRYWLEGDRLMLWAAPSIAGTLYAQFGRALWSQATNADGEVLEIIPNSFLPVVIAETARRLCLQQPDDMVMQSKIPGFAAEVGNEQQGGLADMIAFFAMRNRSYEARLEPATGRVAYGSGNR